MKIFYIAYKHDYTTSWEPTGRLCIIYDTTYLPLVKIAAARGHVVRPFWMDERILAVGQAKMYEELTEAIVAEKPDVCFFDSGLGETLDEKALAEIKRRSSSLTVYICGDDAWNFDHESKHFAPYFSWVVTYYSGAVPRYKALGCKVIASQAGANIDLLKPVNAPKDIDVSFLGTWGPPRAKTIATLQKAGINVVVRGNGWPGGNVTLDEWNSIISRSKIGLCLNEAPIYIGWRSIGRLFFRRAHLGEPGAKIKLDLQNFPDNVRTLWQKRIPNMKSRHFEIPALRTMQITQDADNLKEYYEPGKEIVLYTTTKDLIDKIRYYLAHPEEREAIAQAGYERTLREHTRDMRIREIFEKIGKSL